MAVQSPPAFLQGGTYTALSDRLHLITARVMRDPATSIEARQGLFPDRFPAYSNPSGMDIVVGPGAGVIRNTFASAAGDYAFVNTTNTQVTLAASSPTLNRNDIIGFQVRDAFYSGADTDVILAVIQGIGAAGVPTDPVLPASFLPVVRAVVNANASTPTLQDLRVKTAMSGALMPVASSTERTSLGTQPLGTGIYRTDGLRLEFANGSGGWTTLTVPVVATVAALTSTFPNPTADMLVWVSAVKALFVYSGAGWQHHRSAESTGKLWSTAGNQSIAGGGTQATIVFNQTRVRGSMAANPGAGRLILPLDGFYEINYVSPIGGGSTGRVQSAVYRTRSGVGSAPIHAAGEHKGDAFTYWVGSQSPEIPLQAGDEIEMQVLNSTASSVTVTRTSEINGAQLSVRYVRALEGVTPV